MRTMAQTTARYLLAILLSGAIISIFPHGTQPALAGASDTSALEERIGKDDGFMLSILVSGDTHGSLETCG